MPPGTFRAEPDPDWEPELQRIALVLDLDVTMLATPVETWALSQLRALSNRLNGDGIIADPVRIEVDGRMWLA